jgi:hypothetical protein
MFRLAAKLFDLLGRSLPYFLGACLPDHSPEASDSHCFIGNVPGEGQGQW